MFEMWDVRNVDCWKYEMFVMGVFGMWDVWDVECSGFGMFGIWNV